MINISGALGETSVIVVETGNSSGSTANGVLYSLINAGLVSRTFSHRIVVKWEDGASAYPQCALSWSGKYMNGTLRLA